MLCEFGAFNENCMTISIKNSAFDFPWNYLKLCEYQLSFHSHLNSESLGNLKFGG